MIIQYSDALQPAELFKQYPVCRAPRGNPRGRNKRKYLDCVCAFDIETSTEKALQLNFMYIWQFQLDQQCTIIGRRWYEFKEFITAVSEYLEDVTLVIYVHNLSYEFQYLKGIFEIGENDVFASDLRRIIKFTALDNIEFRCSMMLSNMSLKQFTHTMQVEHQKLEGKEIYDQVYYPWSDLPDHVLQYSIYDVIGLVEAVKAIMKLHGDNLYTIPLTSTGYPRRDMKRAMKHFPHNKLKKTLPPLECYELLEEAFRGGDTHANRYYAGIILDNVVSADRSSSYPDVMCNCMFPMGEWIHDDPDPDVLHKLLQSDPPEAVLAKVVLFDVKLSDPFNGDPYIPRDKCSAVIKGIYDNGRILSAEQLCVAVTDIDLFIIEHDYRFSEIAVLDLWHSRYGWLPSPFIKVICDYFEMKTKLKGVADKQMEYDKAKAKLNGLFGILSMRQIRDEIIFRDGALHYAGDLSREELLNQAYQKAYCSYAWG